MGFEFREVTAEDVEAVRHIWSIVYRRGEPIEPGEEVPRADRLSFVGFLDGRPGAAFSIMPMKVTRGDGTLSCAGVASVAVLPEARNARLGSAFMEWSLGDLRARGYETAALYAYRDSFYRRFGYEVTGRRWQIRCPPDRLPDLEPTLPVRHVTPEEAHLLDRPYRAFARARSGLFLREQSDWINRFGKRPPMIYAAGDPVEAYAWVSMEGSFWDDLPVGEFVWSTPAGYETMLATLRALDINRGALIWHEPSDGPFLLSHMDQGVRVCLDRHTMFRALEVPNALRRLVPESSGEFRIRVDDSHLPANVGPWQVRFGLDGVEVSPTKVADLELGIAAFSQALMGEPSLEVLLHAGKVASHDEAATRAARALLSPRPTILMDYF